MLSNFISSVHFIVLRLLHFTLLSLKRICILQLMITSKIYGIKKETQSILDLYLNKFRIVR